jgi:hypothetical protein
VVLAVAGLATACGAARSTIERAEAPSAAQESNIVVQPPAQPVMDNSGAGSGSVEDLLAGSAQAQQSRVIIYTGDISLVVRDTREAASAITELADAQGGYVAGSNIYQSDDVPRGSITIRIPAELYQDTMAKLRALAIRVERESSNTQDVTEEFTDLQARKANLEVTEEALQELLRERQRVGSTADILEVYRELTNVRGQIEQIEGRLRYLATQSALSTITVNLIPDVLYQPISVAGWQPQGVAKEALQALVVTLQGLGNVAIWLLVFGVPVLLVLLVPVVLAVWVIRWWWKRYRARSAPAPAESPKA